MAYQGARLLSMLGMQMTMVALGWHVYDMTGQPKNLAYLGLAQFTAAATCSPFTGLIADRMNRKVLLSIAHAMVASAAIGFYFVASHKTHSMLPVYALCTVMGCARSLGQPAGQALMPSLVPRELFTTAVAWASTSIQLAMILGPWLGGMILGVHERPAEVYAACAITMIVSLLFIIAIPHRRERDITSAAAAESRPKLERASVLSGLRYVWTNKPVLGVISLDLFAVLLGGATALLPIFVRDRLHMGASGLGLLRAAPAIGATLVAVMLAYFPLRRRAGLRMFVAVFIFGLATIVFGVSQNVWLSFAALVVTGAADMISVVVRLTLVQLNTPDEMRGRVSAVNGVFIGASNELGEFESGITAQFMGPVAAVVMGGVGTCLVVLAWSGLFPQIRKIDNLETSA